MKTYNKVEIKNSDEHYDCFVDNKFFCSGDTPAECWKEIENEYGGEDEQA